jgi:hypothetical protein
MRGNGSRANPPVTAASSGLSHPGRGVTAVRYRESIFRSLTKYTSGCTWESARQASSMDRSPRICRQLPPPARVSRLGKFDEVSLETRWGDHLQEPGRGRRSCISGQHKPSRCDRILHNREVPSGVRPGDLKFYPMPPSEPNGPRPASLLSSARPSSAPSSSSMFDRRIFHIFVRFVWI